MSLTQSQQPQPPQLPWTKTIGDAGAALNSFWVKNSALMVFFCVILLVVLGLITIHSATISSFGNRYFYMQLLWVVIGFGAFGVAAFMPMQRFYRWSLWGLLAVMVVMLYLLAALFLDRKFDVVMPMAPVVKGAVRWLRFTIAGRSVQVQPSEFAKVLLLLTMAGYYGRCSRKYVRSFIHGAVIPGALLGVVLLAIIAGKDLSTCAVTGAVGGSVMFFAGVKWRWLITFGLIGLLFGAYMIMSSPMRQKRMMAFRNPQENRYAESYQLHRSQVCLGVGGATGIGYAKGYMKSYLPESYTDFIVAVIGEEMGMVGVLGVILLYLGMCFGIFLVARQCRAREDMLFCLGVAVWIAVQSLVNISVVSGCCPPTGVTAPFLSYGGSSIIVMFFAIGLVYNVFRRNMSAIEQEAYSERTMPSKNLRWRMRSDHPQE